MTEQDYERLHRQVLPQEVEVIHSWCIFRDACELDGMTEDEIAELARRVIEE